MSNTNTWINDDKTILVNVLKSISQICNLEGETQALTVPINEPKNRITFYTGLSSDEISRLTSIKQKLPTLNLQSRIALLDLVRTMLENEGSLDYPGLFRSLTAQNNLNRASGHASPKISTYNEFVEEMQSLGYIIKETIDDSKTIIEDPEVRFERYNYLNRMKRIRNSNSNYSHIVYIDERIISTVKNVRFQKIWPPTDSNTDPNLTVFFHAVSSKTGYINGLYSNQVTHKNFCKWVTDILLGHLKEPSLIVLDRNPLHGVQQNVCPITRYHSKKDMLRWLAKYHIPCSSNMDKPALYELCKKSCDDSMEYKIDSIIRSHGHDVMRLPRFLYDLSITTPLWDHVITYKSALLCNKNQPFELQHALINFMCTLGSSQWHQFNKAIEKKEKDILTLDIELDTVMETFEFKLD